MTLRQKLACVGLTVFGLQIASAAAGGAPLADRLRLWLDALVSSLRSSQASLKYHRCFKFVR
jgi:hypothetical protein